MMIERVVMNSTQEVKFDLFLGKMNSEGINEIAGQSRL